MGCKSIVEYEFKTPGFFEVRIMSSKTHCGDSEAAVHTDRVLIHFSRSTGATSAAASF